MHKQWLAMLSVLGLAGSAGRIQGQVLKGSVPAKGKTSTSKTNITSPRDAATGSKLQVNQQTLRNQNQGSIKSQTGNTGTCGATKADAAHLTGVKGGANTQLTKANANNQITKGNANNAITKGNANNAITKGNANNAITKGNANNAVTKGNANNALTKGNANNQLTKGSSNAQLTKANNSQLTKAGDSALTKAKTGPQ